MAIANPTIEAVRVTGSDGIAVEYPWDPHARYLIRDDCPYLDIRTSRLRAQVKDGKQLPLSSDDAAWQRWDLETDLAWQRRLGEVNLPLKVPKHHTLRCYIIPTMLLSYPDVIAMVEDIEAELGVARRGTSSPSGPNGLGAVAVTAPKHWLHRNLFDLSKMNCFPRVPYAAIRSWN